jgi:imidazolonepropionase-like amidohydrolase
MKAFIAELAERGTIVDPTLVIFESLAVPPGEGRLPPAYAPYAGLFPAPTERQWGSGGYPLVEGLTRDDYRASVRKLTELVGVLHEAGITIVAGTDGQGIELVREIELYETAGMSKAEALASATLVPARVVGADERTGSIRVGKEADLVLVDGDVSRELGALRRVVTVVSDGTVMGAAELRAAAGITGPPK